MPAPGTAADGTFEGRCVGGPLDGGTAACRYRAGFVLADKPAGRVWIYDRADDGTFRVREGAGRALDHRRAIAATLGEEYDVIAAAWDGETDGRP